MNAHVPRPRDAVVREATAGDEHAGYWRAVYYASLAVLASGRGDQALDALHHVLTRPEVRP